MKTRRQQPLSMLRVLLHSNLSLWISSNYGDFTRILSSRGSGESTWVCELCMSCFLRLSEMFRSETHTVLKFLVPKRFYLDPMKKRVCPICPKPQSQWLAEMLRFWCGAPDSKTHPSRNQKYQNPASTCTRTLLGLASCWSTQEDSSYFNRSRYDDLCTHIYPSNNLDLKKFLQTHMAGAIGCYVRGSWPHY